MHAYAWWWLAACSSPENVDSDAPIDTDTVADTDDGDDPEIDTDVDFDSLNGDVPDEALPLPSFSATNRDGSARGPDDLRGHPTVMWFYPAAGTSG
jgi:hypothetical protein